MTLASLSHLSLTGYQSIRQAFWLNIKPQGNTFENPSSTAQAIPLPHPSPIASVFNTLPNQYLLSEAYKM
ncbi:hypothetical protein STEG23_003404, partial [Scotinomys teguina]